MITPAQYAFLQDFLKKRSGLDLPGDKEYLIESRLAPILRKSGLPSLGQLIGKLHDPAAGALADAVVEAMTTNESFFFRDKTPFELFIKELLPEMLARRAASRTIRIWCAAASTGQEPYSLAMALKENARLVAGWTIDILGTDICTAALEKAKAGIYTQFEVQRGLPIQHLVKYFEKRGDDWQLSADIRDMVRYRKFNLLESFGGLGQFDIVFCRNVLIYFDSATKADVLGRIARVMPPDGYLVLGGAETVLGVTQSFRPVQGRQGVYMPNHSPSASLSPTSCATSP